MRFRIATLLYVIAYLAVSIAAFGAWGMLLAVGVLGAWGVVHGASHKAVVFFVLAVPLFLWGASFVLEPYVSIARSYARWSTCRNQMRVAAFALQNYAEREGHFPEAVVYSESGEPLHSWRTLLLPYMEESPLFQRIDLAEPWDGPANRMVTAGQVWEYCPEYLDASSETPYFAIVDQRTIWSEQATAPAQIPDGASNTIQLLEADLGAQWAEPRDLTFDEAIDLLTGATPGAKATDIGSTTAISIVQCSRSTSPLPTDASRLSTDRSRASLQPRC